MTLTVGSILENRYRIELLLGQGGMGAVYRAYDTRLQQAVAIKENTMAVPGISPEVVAASRHQFEREALMLARLRHPNLPRVGDHFVTPDGNQYLVMDYIEGDDLGHIIARSGPLPEAQAIAWISQACSALEYLHTQDPPIIHRDIKPQNIKVTPKGVVFLVDFGIAKVGEVSKTAMGALGVTPGFSPPEQYAMTGTDARSDIYALGATLYALLTGHVPPESISLMSGEAHLMPPQQVNSTVSPVVQQAVLKAMEPRKTDRPQSMAEFWQMLTTPGRYPQGAIPIALDSAPPPTQLMGAAAADEKADKRIPAAPPPKPAPAPIAPLKLAAPSTYAERVRVERNPLPLLWAGAGIVAIVLVVAVLKLQAPPTPPAPRPPTATPGVATKATEPTKLPAVGATRVSEKDSMAMVYVPAGEFLMGSADSDKDASSDEKPQHTVYLDAFWIDHTEVTNAQYKKCVQAGTCTASSYASDSSFNGDTQPVVGVDWNNAVTYCEWVGRQLPTEAQWEKAARGTDGCIYPWGNQTATCEYAVMDDGSGKGCGKGSAAWVVGSKPKGASPYGALDMAGNVWEWAADWYDGKYYASSPFKNPTGPSSGSSRVLRGGSWDFDQTLARATFRGSYTPDSRLSNIGFRCLVVGPGQ
jgi:formylglycine-generating enzyme required for sulfatase activity